MSKFKESIEFIIGQLKRSVQRFPITLGITAIFMIVAIMLTHAGYDASNTDQLEKMLFALAIGIPMTAAATLFIENFRLVGLKRALVHVGAIFMTFVYYLTIPTDMNAYFGMRFVALWAILFLAFLAAPYFYRREGLSRYVLHLAGRFFLTALFSGVILGGIAMMIFTIEALFNVNWPDEIYLDLFIVVSGAFAVTHFLGSVPEIDKDLDIKEFSKIFKSLFLYIVLPIVSVYTVILYAYFVKILFNFRLPDGIIGNLVLWYALVSVTTLFFIRDLRSEVPWLSKFIKIYIPLMVVPLTMLFIAIGIRINAYGMTMPRYFVFALAIFSTVSLLIMWLRKNDTALVTVIVLMAFITLTFFGPLSGYSMTLSDQSNRLVTLLEQNKMIGTDGKVVPNAALDEEQKRAISEKIDFLLNAYSLEEVTVLPDDFDRSKAKAHLGFDMTYYWPGEFEQTYFNYYTKDDTRVVTVTGADYFILTNHYDMIAQTMLKDQMSLEKASNDSILRIKNGSTTLLEIDLKNAAATYYLDQTQNVVIKSADGLVTATLEFISINGQIKKDGQPNAVEDLDVQSYDIRILLDLQ